MTIEWLGEESGLWFGMMIEGVVAVNFSGRALHCVHNLRETLSISHTIQNARCSSSPVLRLLHPYPLDRFAPERVGQFLRASLGQTFFIATV